jgi:hypothetical protein
MPRQKAEETPKMVFTFISFSSKSVHSMSAQDGSGLRERAVRQAESEEERPEPKTRSSFQPWGMKAARAERDRAEDFQWPCW